jgi:ketosteroid isomerase-like protein
LPESRAEGRRGRQKSGPLWAEAPGLTAGTERAHLKIAEVVSEHGPHDAGEHVVVRGVQRATGAGGSFESRYLHLFKLRDGKIVRGEYISDTAKAKEALGS